MVKLPPVTSAKRPVLAAGSGVKAATNCTTTLLAQAAAVAGEQPLVGRVVAAGAAAEQFVGVGLWRGRLTRGQRREGGKVF
jgi:hypothetical protein